MRTPSRTLAATGPLLALGLATFAACDQPTPSDSAEPLGEAVQASIAAPICTTVQRGVNGAVRDALLNSAQPDKAYGASGSLTAGQSGGAARESVLGFDLSFIPAGSTISMATLNLFQLLPTGTARPVRVHRATAAWSEATVTWNSFGGARAPQVEAQIAPVPAYSAASADLTGLVQQWADGTPNHGMVLERDLDGSTVYATSEGVPAQHPALSVCYVPPFCHDEADGTACDDGDPSTAGDHCQAGVCAGVDHCLGVTCVAQDPCHVAGVCDHATGACSNPPAANGTACDDGDPHTLNDVCTAGVCAGQNLCLGVSCPAPADACHVLGACDFTTGLCSNPAAPDGTVCSDGSASTSGDRCLAGVCTPVATCSDNVQNQGEVGIDCGGPCGACPDDGSTAASAGATCAAIHAAHPGLPSGAYWIDPDGAGGLAPFSAYCDMATGGGGWTLFMFVNAPNTSPNTSLTRLDPTTLSGYYYMSQAPFAALGSPGMRVRAWAIHNPNLYLECDYQSDGTSYKNWQANANCVQRVGLVSGGYATLSDPYGFLYASPYDSINPANPITTNSVFTKANNGSYGSGWAVPGWSADTTSNGTYKWYYGQWATQPQYAMIYAIR